MTVAELRKAPDDQLTRDITCIKMHLEIADTAQRTRAVMPSLVNFKDALMRFERVVAALTPLS
jgi:hypothetical protein